MSQIIGVLSEKIANAKSIAIISHSAPDADAFASSVALREIIKKSQQPGPSGRRSRKRIDVYMEHDKLPNSLDIFFPKKEKESGFKFMNPEKPLKKYDLAIALDCASKERMGIYGNIFDSAKHTFNIDHHATNTNFADNNIVLKTSSTCEGLYYLFSYKQKIDFSKYVLSLLYSGILTDTNNLKNNADFKVTELAVSRIKQKLGVSLAKRIRANFFESNSVAKDELYAYAYSKKHRKYLADDKFCLIVLNHKAFKQSGADMDDAEGIVDEALYRKGLIASAIILEKEKNKLYVKLRSKDGIDISQLAKQFNGGGHTQIAAFQYEGSVISLVAKLVPEIEKFVANEKVEEPDVCPELFE
jgi:phosphoesterase RecJ-like protein